MKKLLLPLVLLLAGTGGGVGAGLFLAPPPAEDIADNALISNSISSASAKDAAQAACSTY